MKYYVSIVLENSVWLIGDEKLITFWNDKWLSQPISTILNLPNEFKNSLKAKVSDYIVDGQWQIPYELSIKLNASAGFNQVTIPKILTEDRLVWMNSNNGMGKGMFFSLHVQHVLFCSRIY